MSESTHTRGTAPQAGILATQPVSASEWLGGARLQNHIVGRGRVIVPAFRPPIAKLSVGEYAFAIRVVPSYQALVRRWRVSARVDGKLKFDVNGAASPVETEVLRKFPDLEFFESARSLSYSEILASQSLTEAAYVIELTTEVAGGHTSGDMEIDSIECVEYPRAVIADGSPEFGVNVSAFRVTQPITDAAFSNIFALSQSPGYGRRVHFHTAVPYAKNGSTITTHAFSKSAIDFDGGTFSNMFDVAKPCLARKLYNDGNDHTECNFRAFAWVSSGGSGQIRVTSAAGSSGTVTITNTTPAWTSVVPDVFIACDDFTKTDGVPVAGYDDVQVEFRATAGTLYVTSTILYE